MCASFLSGMSQTFDLWKAFNASRKQSNPPLACIPSGIRNQDMARAVVNFLAHNPKTLDLTYSIAAALALQDAYPCK